MNKNVATDINNILKQSLKKQISGKLEKQLNSPTNQLTPTGSTAALLGVKNSLFAPAIDLANVKFTSKVCITNNDNETIEFPSSALREQYIKRGVVDIWLAGFENPDGKSCFFNFVLSNLERTEQYSEIKMKEYMMTEGRQIKSAQIFCNNVLNLEGFCFFDREGNVIFEIGKKTETVHKVVLKDNEQIIGIRAKLYKNYQTVYSDFQFMICQRLD